MSRLFTESIRRCALRREEIRSVVSIIPCAIWKCNRDCQRHRVRLSSALYTKDVNKAFAAFATSRLHHLHQCAEIALKFIFPSRHKAPATDTAKAHWRLISIRSGSRCTSIIRTRCRRRNRSRGVNRAFTVEALRAQRLHSRPWAPGFGLHQQSAHDDDHQLRSRQLKPRTLCKRLIADFIILYPYYP